ncbi:MAG: hypothetical protein HY290_33560 [Planctomycetia bacterium]|nr:hypothetical protein [Planctomycetia bacterium]
MSAVVPEGGAAAYERTASVELTDVMLAASWSTPLIVGDCVYIGDQDGDITVFKVSKVKEQVSEQNMGIPGYNSPVVANGVLYIAAFNTLFALEQGANAKPAAAAGQLKFRKLLTAFQSGGAGRPKMMAPGC